MEHNPNEDGELTDRIPPPMAVRERISHLLGEGQLLRALLKVSERKQRMESRGGAGREGVAHAH